MLSAENQKYLISTARNNYGRSLNAINKSDYCKRANNEQDKDIAKMLHNDIADFYKILNADTDDKAEDIYFSLDTASSDAFIEIIQDEYCFMDADMMMVLSDLVIRAMENNNKAAQGIYNRTAIDALNRENKDLQQINSMLCRYADKLGYNED